MEIMDTHYGNFGILNSATVVFSQKFLQINVILKNFSLNWFDEKKCVAVNFLLFHTRISSYSQNFVKVTFLQKKFILWNESTLGNSNSNHLTYTFFTKCTRSILSRYLWLLALTFVSSMFCFFTSVTKFQILLWFVPNLSCYKLLYGSSFLKLYSLISFL